jgi:hypothetical protein
MTASPREGSILKILAYGLLLPLLGVNLLLVVSGIAEIANPGFLGSGPGWIGLLIGLIGLTIQLSLMLIAREAPGIAGWWFAGIGTPILLVGLAIGTWSEWPLLLITLAPLPGAVVLIMEGRRLSARPVPGAGRARAI